VFRSSSATLRSTWNRAFELPNLLSMFRLGIEAGIQSANQPRGTANFDLGAHSLRHGIPWLRENLLRGNFDDMSETPELQRANHLFGQESVAVQATLWAVAALLGSQITGVVWQTRETDRHVHQLALLVAVPRSWL
jgi:hypothetical protein